MLITVKWSLITVASVIMKSVVAQLWFCFSSNADVGYIISAAWFPFNHSTQRIQRTQRPLLSLHGLAILCVCLVLLSDALQLCCRASMARCVVCPSSVCLSSLSSSVTDVLWLNAKSQKNF